MKSIRSTFFLVSLLVLSVLQVSCVDVNAPLESGELPLHAALEKRDVAEVRRLLDAGADPNLKSSGLLRNGLHSCFIRGWGEDWSG